MDTEWAYHSSEYAHSVFQYCYPCTQYKHSPRSFSENIYFLFREYSKAVIFTLIEVQYNFIQQKC